MTITQTFTFEAAHAFRTCLRLIVAIGCMVTHIVLNSVSKALSVLTAVS